MEWPVGRGGDAEKSGAEAVRGFDAPFFVKGQLSAWLVFGVVHLHHVPADAALRATQVDTLRAWLDASPDAEAQIVVGDFNAAPDEAAAARMRDAGFRSAYAQANGADPAVTWPSGLQAPAMDTDGDPACLDYVWVRGAVTVEDARLFADRPAVGDATLYPSDHLGIAAHVRVGG